MERWRMTFSSWSTSDQVTTTLGVPLNPIDVKFIDFLAPVSSSLGCDFAGVVSSISSEATGTWKLGDHVAGFVQGGLASEYGSFAEYVKAESDLVWKIPDSISDENAATWGVSGVTAMMALNHHLGVPWLDSNGRPRQEQAQNTSTGSNDEFSHILIYAGSTSVGLFAIQLAKAAGLTVITTCSPHSFFNSSRRNQDILSKHHPCSGLHLRRTVDGFLRTSVFEERWLGGHAASD
jgi:NADPH:quinone reductase-like Zn-dependent oxidoreductase